MTPCPECGSNEVYRFHKQIDANGPYGPELLPKLNPNWHSSPKIVPVVCSECGLTRFFASKEARVQMKSSDKWELL